MVAFASHTIENSHRCASQRFEKPLSRVRGNSAIGSHRARSFNSLNRIEMRLSIYESRDRLESFSRDPIGYEGVPMIRSKPDVLELAEKLEVYDGKFTGLRNKLDNRWSRIPASTEELALVEKELFELMGSRLGIDGRESRKSEFSLYRFVYNSPINYVDPFGTSGTFVTVCVSNPFLVPTPIAAVGVCFGCTQEAVSGAAAYCGADCCDQLTCAADIMSMGMFGFYDWCVNSCVKSIGGCRFCP